MTHSKRRCQTVVVGAGFSGLSAAYELARNGVNVVVIDSETQAGGLAATFELGNTQLECFYHHWFKSDSHALALVNELGLNDCLHFQKTQTSTYYANQFFKLTHPWDLLRFSALPLLDRLRLGWGVIRARRITNPTRLESITAEDWLIEQFGRNVYQVVWKPLLVGKFGAYASKIAAVWFWNKIKLRGGSRNSDGHECLVYLRGGFDRLTRTMVQKIEALGGQVILGERVTSVLSTASGWSVATPVGNYESEHVLMTPAFPIVANLIENWAPIDYLAQLRSFDYLANTCLILQLNRGLSSTYWLNVNDPHFPFVGVVEHTNLENPDCYDGSHVIYLSRYIPSDEAYYALDANETLRVALPYLKQMFPEFQDNWIVSHHLWKAPFAQPVVDNNYRERIPAHQTPFKGLFLCSMAQIYPEDRGTNYAIREGRRTAQTMLKALTTIKA